MVLTGYPCVPTREGYVYTIVFPEPLAVCNQMHVRPTTQGYQFQAKIVLKGWCRIRGLLLYALPKPKPQFQGIACPPNPTSGGMAILPNPFQVPITATPVPNPIVPPTPQPPTPPQPTPLPPHKATNPNPANGASNQNQGTTILSWDDGGGATSFNVYINGVLQGNQAGTTFNPGALGFGVTVTWRIDSVNSDGTTTGDTWTFSTAPFNSMVMDWEARVLVNGGADPSIPTLTAMSAFADALDAANLTAKMIAVNCFVPDNLIAAITPLIKVAGNDPWTNIGPFVVGDLTVNGLVGDGATKYLDTGVIPNVAGGANYATNPLGLSAYFSTTPASPAQDVGSFTGIFDLRAMILELFSGTSYWVYPYDSGSAWMQSAGTPAGYYSGNRTAGNVNDFYFANSGTPHGPLVATNVQNEGANLQPSHEIYAFAINASGSPNGFSNKRISFVAIHFGLTQAESLSLFNAVQTLRTALGGGFV